jgi:two-component system chemotaxis response regulator CheB
VKSSVDRSQSRSIRPLDRKIRVLVVDDSPLARKLITAALEAAGDIEVAGCATDGYSACAQISALRPDVLTLDIGMPGMDGITFLRQSQGADWVPAVVISAMTGVGCQTAVEALRAGAVEVIGKPVDRPAFLDFRTILPIKVRAAFACRLRASRSGSPAHCNEMRNPGVAGGVSIPQMRTPGIIAIGSSTGGTEAVETILRQTAEDCPGIVIAQHIPAKFSLMFAARLEQVCRIHVKEAETGDLVRPGWALIAPGDQHMVVQKRLGGLEIALNQGPRVGFQRPSIDTLFRSVAAAAAGDAIGIILTGMGSDGAAGLLEMQSGGATTVAQDEASCVVFGMPKEAIRLGAADHILSLHQIAAAVGRLRIRGASVPGGASKML